MHLYHYTSVAHLRGIHKHGLTVGDVVTNFEKAEGRVAVWLTSSMSPVGHGLEGSAVDKKAFRLTVDVPEDQRLARWSAWARDNISSDTRRRLIAANGQSAASWYLYFGWLPPSRILEVVETATGDHVVDWGDICPQSESLRGVPYEARFTWQNRMLRDVRVASQAGCSS
ncbi:hypothetical protein HFN01_32415 [Rhizobium leguminosarum]|uniref:hypothetical protein n=1 Tax=Rhizobium leguminosarum TaxID=384 RepID=UPI001C97C473|nr:hypothetical protein [Rhizobium leguminosarum]MBY5399506.1 hypothetical protein [Rhizobium leguminosarum]